MNVNKKSVALGLLSGVVIGGATLGTLGVSAQSDENTLSNRIADRFGLSSEEVSEEVQAFREERREERQAERAEKREAHLQSLVDEGTITEDQKTAIEAKWAELKEEKQALKDQDLTKEEIKAELETLRAEMEAWAEENGIDLEEIKPDRDGRDFKRGFRGFGGPSADDSAEESTDIDG